MGRTYSGVCETFDLKKKKTDKECDKEGEHRQEDKAGESTRKEHNRAEKTPNRTGPIFNAKVVSGDAKTSGILIPLLHSFTSLSIN
jgi:hypothetical protein